MQNNILFFDVESTGLPKSWSAPLTDVNNWPRVIQLAWQLYTNEGSLIQKECDLVEPDGWVVPTGEFWQKHGYTTEDNKTMGIPMKLLLELFIMEGMEVASTVVAHNMKFDRNVLGAEFIRYSLTGPKHLQWVCSMEKATHVCNIKDSRGRTKWPTLTELHQFLFGCDFTDAHDAGSDVTALAKCYFELKKRNSI